MMRLFVAVRPPPVVRDALLDTMGGVAAARWQDDDQLHLTLRFIGEVNRRVASDIATALDSVRHPPIAARFGSLNSFVTRGRPNSLWIGVEPVAALTTLHHKVDAALGAAIEPDRRAFVPHITLARLGRTAGPLDAALAVPPPAIEFTIDRFGLFESTLTRTAAVYSMLADFAFA